MNWLGSELEQKFVDIGAGVDCTGISKADWVRFYRRWAKVNYSDGRHWCPHCLAAAWLVSDASPQLDLFDDAARSASYVRNSGQIPFTRPHRYQGNLERFRRYARDGAQAVLLQGDSRRLVEIVGWAGGVVGSPVYAGNGKNVIGSKGIDKHKQGSGCFRGNYGNTEGQLGAMPEGNPAAIIASSPFAGNSGGRGQASRDGIDPALFERHSGGMIGGMGDRPENLGNLKHGDAQAVIGSSPYATNDKHDYTSEQRDKRTNGKGSFRGFYGHAEGQLAKLPEGNPAAVIGSSPFAGSVGSDDPVSRGGLLKSDPKRANDKNLTGSYGQTEGQLGAMKGGFEAAISSPPYGNGTVVDRNGIDPATLGSHGPNSQALTMNGYGQTAGQLDAEPRETFWQAARQIIEQCYQLLPSGGVAIWVCKNFVRDHKRVPFCDQWRALCEAVGFEHLETIRAWQVKHDGDQVKFGGEIKAIKTEKKSFFRRNHEKKYPHLSIDWEEVICLRKP